MGGALSVPFSGGFGGTASTAAEVTFYTDDGPLRCRGLRNSPRGEPMVVSFSTTKAFGQAMGSFSLQLSVPHSGPDLFERIVDDTWLDIVAIVNGRRWHVLRGLTSGVTSEEMGAEVRYTVEGFDFGRVFDRTPIWFNVFRNEDAFSQALKIFEVPNVAGTPDEAVRRVIYGFLDSQVTANRAGNWSLPEGMPGRRGSFPETFEFDSSGFDAARDRRIAVSQQFMSPEGQSAWALAQEWSDPTFCELWCDLGTPGNAAVDPETEASPGGGMLDPERPADETATTMQVFFRDRPFIESDLGVQSPWFRLPTVDLVPHEISPLRLSTSGNERYNAFFVSPRVLQNAGVLQSLVGPLWDPADIERHGLRSFNIDSRYLSESPDLFTLTESLRKRARDYHCLNPRLLSGTLNLVRWRPDIRIGYRVRIRDADPSHEIWAYVESVTQKWSLSGGGRTSLSVTRGWRGTEQANLDAVLQSASRYEYLLGHGDVLPLAVTTAGLSFFGSGRKVDP